MVVAPSTTSASADFYAAVSGPLGPLSPFQDTAQTSPDKVRYLSPDPGCVYIGLLWPFLDFAVSCQLIRHPMPLYAVLVHPVQVLPSGLLPPHARSRSRSCLWLAVRRVNVRRSFSLPSYRPCRAYIRTGCPPKTASPAQTYFFIPDSRG
jgi:hypothetical protein